ncbi:MAG TPA: hypothetical protein VIV14_12090 [Gammaproteobacteria bacterium]
MRGQYQSSRADRELQIKRAAITIAAADHLLITAGAGMGVDSGLPDYRGSDGFWNAYPPLREQRLRWIDLAQPDAFRTMPDLAWGFYGSRLDYTGEHVPTKGSASFAVGPLQSRVSLSTRPT